MDTTATTTGCDGARYLRRKLRFGGGLHRTFAWQSHLGNGINLVFESPIRAIGCHYFHTQASLEHHQTTDKSAGASTAVTSATVFKVLLGNPQQWHPDSYLVLKSPYAMDLSLGHTQSFAGVVKQPTNRQASTAVTPTSIWVLLGNHLGSSIGLVLGLVPYAMDLSLDSYASFAGHHTLRTNQLDSLGNHLEQWRRTHCGFEIGISRGFIADSYT
jgi:hypothetical protein